MTSYLPYLMVVGELANTFSVVNDKSKQTFSKDLFPRFLDSNPLIIITMQNV